MDRLHVPDRRGRDALDAQLVRRAAAAAALAPGRPLTRPAANPGCSRSPPRPTTRTGAPGRRPRATCPAALRRPSPAGCRPGAAGRPDRRGCQRVVLARRFYNDAVRDTVSLRRRRLLAAAPARRGQPCPRSSRWTTPSPNRRRPPRPRRGPSGRVAARAPRLPRPVRSGAWLAGCSGAPAPAAAPSPTTAVADPRPDPVAHAVAHAVGHAEAQAAAGAQPAVRAGRRTEAAGPRGQARQHRNGRAAARPRGRRRRLPRAGRGRAHPAAAVFAAGTPRASGRSAAPASPTSSCCAAVRQGRVRLLRRRRCAGHPAAPLERGRRRAATARPATGGSAAGPRRTTCSGTWPRWPAGARGVRAAGRRLRWSAADPRLARARRVGAVSIMAGKTGSSSAGIRPTRRWLLLRRTARCAARPPAGRSPRPNRSCRPAAPHRPDRRRRARHAVGLHVHCRHRPGARASATAGCVPGPLGPGPPRPGAPRSGRVDRPAAHARARWQVWVLLAATGAPVTYR